MEYFKSIFGFHENAHTHILITYGSQTGCAKGIAEYIYKEKIQVFKKIIKPLNDIEIKDMLKYNIIIILISTTGNGEFPDNARIFWKKFRKYKENFPINYILCGFGSYDYPNFCHTAKCLERKLKRLNSFQLMETTFINNECEEDIDYFISSLQDICNEFINDKQNNFIQKISK